MKYNPSGLILFCQTKIILKYDANAGQIYGRLKILGLASYQPLLYTTPTIFYLWIQLKMKAGQDETNFLGRAREIRLMKIHYETKTEKKLMLIFSTRRDCLIFYVRDETETRLNSKIPGETKTRTNFKRKKNVYLAKLC